MKKLFLIISIVILSTSLKAQEFLNYANLCFAKMDTVQLFSAWSRPVAIDFNKDGKMDFAVIDKSYDSLQVFFNDGSAKFTTFPPIKIYIGNSAKDLCIGDFDGDTFKDIATIDAQGDITVFKNLGGTGISLVNVFINSAFPNLQAFHIEAADLNNDSKPDIIGTGQDLSTLSMQVYTFRNMGSLNFTGINSFTVLAAHSLQSSFPTVPIAIADFNSDGYNDFVVGTDDNTDTLEIYPNLGTASISFSSPTIFTEPFTSPVKSIKTADYDGDSKPDFAIAAFGGFSIIQNTGSFNFNSIYLNPTVVGAEFAIKDIDSDTKPDLVMADYAGSFYVVRGTTSLGYPFGLNTPFFVGESYRFLLENFDSNNIPDFVFVGEGDYPYLLNFRNFSFNLKETIVSTNTVVCPTSPVLLNAIINPIYTGNFMWWPVALTGPSLTVTSAGFYNCVFSYTLPPGYGQCSLLGDTLNIQAMPTPTGAIGSSISVPVCAGTSVDLTASVISTTSFTWSTGSTSYSISVTPSVTTVYTLNLDNGCPGSETLTINVNPNPLINISATTTICSGDSLILTVSGASTYTWSPITSNSSSITVSPASTSAYSVIGTNGFGCSDTTSTTITVNTPVAISIVSSKPFVCFPDTVTLNAVGGAASYTWSTGSNLSAITVTPIISGNYTLTANNGCLSTATISIPILLRPSLTAVSNPSMVCNSGSVTIQAFGAATYTWSNLFIGSTFTDNPVSSTTYSVLGLGSNGCYNYTTVAVSVYTPNAVSILSNGELCLGKAIDITVVGAQTYTWNTGTTNSSFQVVPSNLAPLSYSVTATDANGCKSNASQVFVVSDKCQLVIYNGITPNGDGKNDIFFLENIEMYPGNIVRIFNRWGQLLDEIHNYNNTSKFWSGTEQGVPSGTYYYVIDLNNGKGLIKGWIELTKKDLN